MSGSELIGQKKVSGAVVMTDRILNNFFFTEMKSMNLERRRVESRTDFINHFTCVKTADRLPSILLFFPLCLSKTHITNFQGHLSENCSPLRLIPSFNLFLLYTDNFLHNVQFHYYCYQPVHLQVGKLAVHDMEHCIFLYQITETSENVMPTQKKKKKKQWISVLSTICI